MSQAKTEIKFYLHEGYERRPVFERLYELLKRLPDNKDWEIGVRRKVRKRSLDQNSLLHAIFNDVAEQIGENPAKVKEDFKDALGLKVQREGLDHKVREVNKPTEEYEVEEMTGFLSRIIVMCDELGFDIAAHKVQHDATSNH